jgi:hypothetical protein
MGSGVSQQLTASQQSEALMAMGYEDSEVDDLRSKHLGVSKLEVKALEALYHSTGGDGWNDKTNWCSSEDVSTWKGCKVHEGHLVELGMYGNNLKGTFPEEFYNLPALRILELGANHGLEGGISHNVDKLVSLKVWATNSCGLSGSIPAGFGALSSLDELLLNDNKLTGQCPSSVLNRQGLSLEIRGNSLSASDEVALHVPQWEWYMMSRDNILELVRIPSHEEAKEKRLLHRMNVMFKAYEKWNFENMDLNDKTTHMEVRRHEVTLFSHRWDTPSLTPAEAHPDLPDNSKLAHIKDYLRANPDIKLCFLDYWSMQQAAAAWQPPNLDAIKGIKTLPYYVHNSGNFVTLCRNQENLGDYMGRAWCQLEILCCNCPFETFTERVYDGARWTGNEPTGKYNAVPTIKSISVWNGPNSGEERETLSFDELLKKQGGIPDASSGGLTMERDRPQIAVVCLTVLKNMVHVHEKQIEADGRSDLETVMKYVTPLVQKLTEYNAAIDNK